MLASGLAFLANWRFSLCVWKYLEMSNTVVEIHANIFIRIPKETIQFAKSAILKCGVFLVGLYTFYDNILLTMFHTNIHTHTYS